MNPGWQHSTGREVATFYLVFSHGTIGETIGNWHRLPCIPLFEKPRTSAVHTSPKPKERTVYPCQRGGCSRAACCHTSTFYYYFNKPYFCMIFLWHLSHLLHHDLRWILTLSRLYLNIFIILFQF